MNVLFVFFTLGIKAVICPPEMEINGDKSMNTATLNQPDYLSAERVTTPTLPNDRLVIAPEIEQPGAANGKTPSAPEKKNRRKHLYAGLAILAASLATGIYYFEFVAPYESTDDAFIEAHVTPIAPQIAGRVAQVLVQDNQLVKQGDVLVQVDPSDYQTKLDEEQAGLTAAKGRLAQANEQATVDQAKVQEEKANLTAAQAEATRAQSDYNRYQAVGNLGVSQSQLDLAAQQAHSADAEVVAARNVELAAEAQAGLDAAGIQTATAEVLQSQADLHQAQLNLSYTQVKAPEAGYVTHRTVESGAYLQIGQPLLAIVPQQVWVVANFKETQLTHMRAGQPVEVHVDAYPQINFKGHVDSIQSGTGPRFSLLPPENASGNYVKVVQRVPVKIVLDNNDPDYILGPGMSVEPDVRVK
jgi:membrane fusion protein (multidrug efflux system)